MMTFTKNLRHMATGADVKHMKDALVALGYLQKSTHSLFGDDTLAAVRAYQRTHRDTEGRPLAVDGVIGRKTWAAIERDRAALDGEQAGEKPEPGEGAPDLPENIGPAAAAAIGAALRGVSGQRQALVRHALAFAYDPEVPAAYPHSLYIRGGNLYNTDLGINTITRARIEASAKRQPEYYSGGSRDMMLRAVEQRPGITGADCSGGIVGLLRHFRFTAPGFDATANSLCANGHSTAIGRDDLRPGDWVGRDGHIGLYAGGGYVVEWAGKLYGCQLTRFDNRRAYDFVGRRLRKLSAWTKFCDPTFY